MINIKILPDEMENHITLFTGSKTNKFSSTLFNKIYVFI